MIGRWIAQLDQYHFTTIHRPRAQHRNADEPSRRTNEYVHREQIFEKLPGASEGVNFMYQKDYEELPIVPYFDKHGRLIPGHPELPRKLELNYLYCTFYGSSRDTNQSKNKRVTSYGTPKQWGR